MSKMPRHVDSALISVIIVVKNGERFLASAIDSILQQDYQPTEIIVVDGQSQDKTAQIAKSFVQIRYIRQISKGVSDAYNIGVGAARGEFIAFLDADDYWRAGFLKTCVDFLRQHEDVVAI